MNASQIVAQAVEGMGIDWTVYEPNRDQVEQAIRAAVEADRAQHADLRERVYDALIAAGRRALADEFADAHGADGAVLSTWLKFDHPDDEEASHEANIYRDGERVRVEWSNTDVGQITDQKFDDEASAEQWLIEAGYGDYTA